MTPISVETITDEKAAIELAAKWSLKQVRDFIKKSHWQFAKTMPKDPHWYTLRGQQPQNEFEAFVMYIRKHGYRTKWGNTWYVKLDVDGWTYWTMGSPLAKTILVNRAKTEKEPQLGFDAD